MLEDHPSLSEIQQYCSLSCAVFQISSHFGQMMTSSFFTFYAIKHFLQQEVMRHMLWPLSKYNMQE